jgi:hypothetical protein
MWNINGTAVGKARFEPFIPLEVLDDYDGPRLFTIQDAEAELNLAYWADEGDLVNRYVVVPTTTQIIAALRNGSITVFDALNQPRCWLCDVNRQGALSECRRVEFEAVPKDSLPAIGTMLFPAPAEPKAIDLEGRIRELDKDRLSFELREIEGSPFMSQRFVFDEELLEDVFQAFQEDSRIRVAGRTFPLQNVAFVLALSKAPIAGT